MSNNNETRICVEKILPQQINDYKNIEKLHQHKSKQNKLAAAFWAQKIWPQGSKIRIAFLGDGNNVPRTSKEELVAKYGGGEPPDPLQAQINSETIPNLIKLIVRERIKPLTNLDIDFVNNPSQANVRISFNTEAGAWSYVGTDHLNVTNDNQGTMNFGWFDIPTCIHEFGHMLGMIHEHQNPRGKTIQWDKKKVINWARQTQGWDENKTNTNIIQKYDVNTINGSNFDPCSIMLYFFPGSLTINNVGSKQNLRLSATDVEWITKVYNNRIESPKILYEKFYNNSFDENLQNCKNKENKYGVEDKDSDNSKSFNWNIFFIIFGIIISITLIVFFIYKFKNSNIYDSYRQNPYSLY